MASTDCHALSSQVTVLEDLACGLAEIYRVELEKSLGDPFHVLPLTRYDCAPAPDDHLYPLRYRTREFGMIFPISRQALIGSAFEDREIFERARQVLEGRGYAVSREVNRSGPALVELAQERRRAGSGTDPARTATVA